MKGKSRRRAAGAVEARREAPVVRPPASAGFLTRAWEQGWLPGLVLMAVTLLAYGPALRGGFLWDDDSWTTGIHGLLKDMKGLGSIWFQPTALQQYYPLTATTFWVDYQFWGFWTTPYHVENVLLHGLSAVLFWRLLRRLKVPGAWLAGWILALHPLMVESAAWITERKNVLSLVLYLGALLAYGRYAGFWEQEEPPRRRGFYWLALGLLLGALLAKTTAFSLPAVLLLVCWWQRGRLRWRQDVLPTVPFFVLAMGLSFVTAWLEKHHVGAQGPEWDLSFGQRCLVAGRVLWFYAGKLFWPAGLCFVYPRWDVDVHSLVQWLYPIAALGVVLGLWLGRKRLGRGPLTAGLFFAGTLFPVLGFMNAYYMRFSFVCDHWAYLSSLGLMALGAAVATRWVQRFKFQSVWLGAALGALLGLMTWRQCGMYRNVETLWRTTLAINPRSNLVHNNLGYELLQRGQVDEAIAEFKAALEYWPNFSDAHNNLGYALLQKGRTDEAMSHLQKALAIDPGDVKIQNDVGMAYLQLGQWDQAMAHFQKALEIQPDFAKAHNNLGQALLQKGRVDEAGLHFQTALQIEPDYAQAHNNLGYLLLQEGRVDEAIGHFQKALAIQPGLTDALNNLGYALFQQGKVDEALMQFQKSLALDSADTMVRNNLNHIAWLLATNPDATKRNGAKAVELARQLDKIADGKDPVYLGTLAAAYAETGQFAEAVTSAQRALQLAADPANAPLAAALQNQLKLYQAGQPYRETAPQPAADHH